jgi:osmotically inducible lipoprotein OsmE
MPEGHQIIELSRASTAQSCNGPTMALSLGVIFMFKKSLAAMFVLAAVTGCANTTAQNPVDFVTYRDQPLVKQVETGMTQTQVLTIGGTPSTRVQRKVHPGMCNNYVLNKEGHEQVYYVSFDANGRVDDKGFMTCEQHEANQRAM